MAELDAQLRLDIDQALRDINQIETVLDRALGSVELRLDSTSARRQLDDLAQQADQALDDVDIDFDAGAASRLNSELNGVERSLEIADREADELTGSLRGAARAASDVDGSAGRLATAFSSIRGSAAGLIAGFGAFAAIRGAIGFATSAKDAFATLQDSANAVKVVFGDAIGTIEAFGESVAQSAGLSTAEFNQAASILGSALQNVGFSADTAATKTVELTQRAADMASIMGGPVSEALGAIQAALRGETDPIERFGVTLSEASVNAQAAALNFKAVAGEFSASDKAAARLGLIMEQTSRFAGDFANTSGDLANAQKVLAAEFENAKASLGEALLPIFQTLLDIGPEVIASIEQLAPSIQAFAVSLGNMLQHREGALDLLDILNGLADLPRAFGEIGSAVSAIGDGFSTIGQTVAAVFNPFDDRSGPEAWAAGMERAAQRGQESIERINTQGLVDDIRGGADAASALANRLGEVGRRGKLDPAFIRGLITIAGTDLRETSAALVTLLGRAEELGQGSDDVEALRIALALLNDESRAEGPIRSVSERIDRIPAAAGPAISALEGIQIAAGEAGVSMGELLTSTDPLIVALREGLTPAQELALAIHGVGEDAAVAADVLNTALGPAVSDAGQALIDFNKNGRVSLNEFIRGLEETVAAALAFQANMLALAAIDPLIIPIILGIPEDEQPRIAQLLVDDPVKIPAVIDAAQIDPSELADNLQEIARQAIELVKSNPSPEQISAWTAAITATDIPGGSALARKALQVLLTGSTEGLTPPELAAIYVASIEGMSQSDVLAALNPALNASLADVTLTPPTEQVAAAFGGVSYADIVAAFEPALQASFADIELPTITPKINKALNASFADLDDIPALNKALNASFADVELPPFTPIITDSIASANTAEVTAEMNAALGVSFADLDPPPFTPIFVAAARDIKSQEVTAALDAALGVSFADIDLSDEGAKAAATYWDGFAAYAPGAIPVVRGSITKTLSNATNAHSPPKLFLDAGIEAGETYWAGFDLADLSPDALITAVGQLSAVGKAAAGSFRTSFEQLEGELPAVIQRSAEAVNLTHFDDLGAAIGRQLTTAVEGDFRLSPELDPLTAEQLLALNLDPATPVIGPADPLTVGQLQEMVDAANAARTVVESQLEAIQFDFELQGYQEQFAALTATTGEVGIAAREAFMVGLSASTSEEVVQLRASILDAINSATESSSPSRLMLRLGGAAGDAYWSGFEQADMQLKVPIPTMTGKISTSTAAAAAGGDAGFTFAPTYVNTETRDLETVVARSEQLMGAVSGILNGRFKL